jgi:hypothetical protein
MDEPRDPPADEPDHATGDALAAPPAHTSVDGSTEVPEEPDHATGDALAAPPVYTSVDGSAEPPGEPATLGPTVDLDAEQESPAVDPDPAAARRGPRPLVTIDTDTRRSRVLVLLRLPLAVPHLLWWWAWSLVVALALPLLWLVALVLGRLPRPLHRVLRAYARYSTHLTAFLSLASNPFPGFLGTLPYPLDLHVPDAVRQPRLSILVRWLAVLPALVVLWVLDWLRWIVVPVAWLIALVVGRLPKGLVEVLTYVARFQALTLAYALLLTRRYPTFGGDQA